MSDDLTFASAGPAGVHYARCWPCMLAFGDGTQHFDPPKWHTWADDDDVDHARETGQPDPRAFRCGCWCSDVPKTVVERVSADA